MDAVLIIAVLSVATTVGAVALTHWQRFATINPVIAPGVAAGVMIWLALGQVAPDSVAAIGRPMTYAAMAAGGALVALVSRFMQRSARAVAGVAPLIGVALALHDVPEGFAVATMVGGMGLVVALPMLGAVAAHNLAEKFAFVGTASNENLPRWSVLLIATLPEPVGAGIAAIGAGVAPGAADVAVALAGGMMLAVALGSLPSLAREARRMRSFTMAGAGGAMSMAMLGVVLPG